MIFHGTMTFFKWKRIVAFSILPLVTALCLLSPGQLLGAENWYERGLSLSKARRYQEAVEAFTMALKKDPRHADAYNNRGVAWYNLGDNDKAIADYNRAVDINPRYADAYNNRGGAWYRKGDYDRAIEDCTKAIEINSRSFDFYNNRGSALHQKGDYDRAITDFSKALRLNPRYAEAYSNRGSAWHRKGDYDRAIADYTKALEINPRSSDILGNRASAWYHWGRYDQAIEDSTKAIDINPLHVDAHNLLAWLLAISPEEGYRDGARALALAQKAVELSREANTLDTLAAAFAEVGRFEEAIATQQKVIDLKKEEGGAEDLSEYAARLDSYRGRKPWREGEVVPETRETTFPRVEGIKVSVANIRTGPTTTAPIVTRLRRGHKVTLIHQRDDWYFVRLSEGRFGWAHKTLFIVEDPLLEAPDADLRRLTLLFPVSRIREAPSFDARIKFRVKKKETVSVLETNGGWHFVRLSDGRTGWAHQSLFVK